jgi:hypothetical protein
MDLKKTLGLEETDKFDGEYNGEKFTFHAKTQLLTPEFLQQLADLSTRPIEYANCLANAITEWDITMGVNAQGEAIPFPPTPHNIAKIPRDFLEYVLDVISESWAGKKQKSSESASA